MQSHFLLSNNPSPPPSPICTQRVSRQWTPNLRAKPILETEDGRTPHSQREAPAALKNETCKTMHHVPITKHRSASGTSNQTSTTFLRRAKLPPLPPIIVRADAVPREAQSRCVLQRLTVCITKSTDTFSSKHRSLNNKIREATFLRARETRDSAIVSYFQTHSTDDPLPSLPPPPQHTHPHTLLGYCALPAEAHERQQAKTDYMCSRYRLWVSSQVR